MALRRLTPFVLLLFVAGLAWTMEGEARHAEGAAETSSCPDGDEDGRPCGPACACACCPGHARLVTPSAPGLVVTALTTAWMGAPALDDPHASHQPPPVFHPPRA